MSGRAPRGGTLRLLDLVLSPLVLAAAWLLGLVRGLGVHRMPACKRMLLRAGVFPVRDHFYEPMFDARHLRVPLDAPRELPGLVFDTDAQLAFVAALEHAHELRDLPRAPRADGGFYLDNGAFEAGDAEIWYGLIRHRRPRRIFEIGSGHSTRVARLALARNAAEPGALACDHRCIEPYPPPWLEACGARVVRERVESLGVGYFARLQAGDVLFIDSSHVIRPQGDVLFEYLELLPSLAPGVIVHVHDIFTPRDYPAAWVCERVRLWNEQYLLEAMLAENPRWRVLAALNHLRHERYEALARAAPFLHPGRQPGSFYMERI